VSEVGKWGERGKGARQGGVVLLGRFSRVCPARLLKGGGREMSALLPA